MLLENVLALLCTESQPLGTNSLLDLVVFGRAAGDHMMYCFMMDNKASLQLAAKEERANQGDGVEALNILNTLGRL